MKRMTLIIICAGFGLILAAGLGAGKCFAQEGQEEPWLGRIVEQTEDPARGGLIVVRVLDLFNVPVKIIREGFEGVCYSGTKPEYGAYSCEMVGLGPGYYSVVLQGQNVGVYLDFRWGGFAFIEFAPASKFPNPPPAPRCLIRVVNETGTPVRVTIAPHEFDFEPGQVGLVAVDPGVHTYTVSGWGLSSQTGQAEFPAGYWTWRIRAG